MIDFAVGVPWQKTPTKTENVAYVALELMRGGELFEYVAMRQGTPLPDPICRTYFR